MEMGSHQEKGLTKEIMFLFVPCPPVFFREGEDEKVMNWRGERNLDAAMLSCNYIIQYTSIPSPSHPKSQ